MNKYQKALNYLDWHCNVVHKKQQDLLQELIDRETRMKPNYITNHQNGDCPICPTIVYRGDNRCIQCGQKLDWSDEE